MLTAIIVAAGSSRRMGFDKLFATLGDRPVIAHAIAAFERTKSVIDIIVTAHDGRIAELEDLVKTLDYRKVRRIIPGGKRRQDSVRNGLEALESETCYVAVHDGARPLVTPEQIERVLASCCVHCAAALAAPVVETLKRSDDDHLVAGSVDREGLYAMQTPQIFSRGLLLKAYAAVETDNLHITDEVSAVEHIGVKVVLVPNDEFNPKITYPRDLLLAESYLTRLPPA